MRNSKFIQLCITLTDQEFSDLGKFVRSPFINTDKNITSFYLHLKKFYPSFDSIKLEKVAVHKHLFKGVVYKDDRMRQLMHKMTIVIEKFLVVQEALEIESNRSSLLLQALSRKDLYDTFSKKSMTYLANVESQSVDDVIVYEQIRRINHELFFHPDTQKFKPKVQSIANCMDYLDLHYVVHKLRYTCEFLTRAGVLRETQPIWLYDQMLKLDEFSRFGKLAPLISLYNKLVKLHNSEKNRESFDVVKEEFSKTITVLPKMEQRYIYLNLLSYCVRQINDGDKTFLEDAYSLMLLGVKHKLILEHGRITETSFTNIVLTASVLGHFAWAQQFIEAYQGCLKEEQSKRVIHLCWAYWFYHQGNLDKMIEYLRVIKFSKTDGARIRSLLLRAHVEKALRDDEDWELALDHIHAFRQFLRREKVFAKQRNNAYFTLLNLTQRLIKWQLSPDSTRIELIAISQEVEKTEILILKHWLSSIVAEMLNGEDR